MRLIDVYIREATEMIKQNNIVQLASVYEYIQSQDDLEFDITFLFQKLFLNACLYGNSSTIEWFLSLYSKLPATSVIAIRHTLVYGKYLIKKRKNKQLYEWYVSKIRQY